MQPIFVSTSIIISLLIVLINCSHNFFLSLVLMPLTLEKKISYLNLYDLELISQFLILGINLIIIVFSEWRNLINSSGFFVFYLVECHQNYFAFLQNFFVYFYCLHFF